MYRECSSKLEAAEKYAKRLEARLSLGGFADQCMKLEQRIQQQQRRIDDDEHTIRNLEQGLNAHAQAAEQLRLALCVKANELSQEPSKLLELAKERQDKDRAIAEAATLRHDFQEISVLHGRLSDRVRTLEEQLENSRKNGAATLASLEEVTEQFDGMAKERKELFVELERAYQELEGRKGAEEAMAKAQAEAQQHHTCWGFAERQRMEEKAKRLAVETTLQELQDWARGVKQHEAEAQSTIETLELRIHEMESQFSDNRSEWANAAGRHEEIEAQLRNTVTQLTDAKARLEQRTAVLDAQVTDIKGHLHSKERELRESHSHAETLQSTLGGSLTSLQAREQALLAEVKSALDEVKHLTLENKKLVLLQEHYKKLVAKAVGSGNTAVAGNRSLPMVAFGNTHQSNVSLSPFTPTPRKSYESGGPLLDTSNSDCKPTGPPCGRQTLADLASWKD